MNEIDEFYLDLQETMYHTVIEPEIEYGYYIPSVTYGYLYTVNANGVKIDKLRCQDTAPIRNIMLHVYSFSADGWEIINFDGESISMKRIIKR